ncbi:MAG TPA: VCBS repeat-containing protein [Thermoanaerobaculia bacterium]|nr:VCBS repeat-containing protein [Thermoanaerobaculia bacterium]
MSKSRSVRRAALGAALLLPWLLSSAPPAAGQIQVGPAICLEPVPINPPGPTLTPWNYESDSGEYVWGEHQFYEDPGDTVFSLARDLVSLGAQQPDAYPDVLLFNFAQFDPPEGIATVGAQTRKLMEASIEGKGLALLVNYSDALIDPAQPVRYGKPTFFQSIDGHHQNVQTNPPVPWSGFSQPLVSATRGAWGCAFQKVLVAVPIDPDPHPVAASAAAGSFDVLPLNPVCDDLYVTAGIGYGLADLDPDPEQQGLAAQAQTDLLMRRDPTSGRWFDVAQDACPTGPRIPVSASAGNSSGVVFRDLTGDGWADLYIGKQGDNYAGAKNVLLVNDGTGCFRDETATRIPGELSRATNEVAAIDLDKNGTLDLVVANRCARAGCGIESEDYVLLNNGTGQFTVSTIATGKRTDSRSVAVGDLNKDGYPEIVLGNAGSDGFSQNLILSSGEDHPMEIYFNNKTWGGTLNAFTDKMDPVLDPFGPTYVAEHEVTAPLTQQVLLVDLFGPQPTTLAGNNPDGWLDLVIVNHRDLLKHDNFTTASRVWVVSNQANWTGGMPTVKSLFGYTAFPSAWVKTVAVADFDKNGFKDLFQGRGNRWSGVLPEFQSNLGSGPGAVPGHPWNDNDLFNGFPTFKSYQTMPATEHGYGFDFADLDGDGVLDALQTSRGYDYLVFNLLGVGEADHREYASPSAGSGLTSNKRGRQMPQGMEDGVFADFDQDGDRDALLASQRTPGWPFCADTTPDSIVLVNAGSGTFGYDSILTLTPPPCSTEDARIDFGTRTSNPKPGIADRAVAGDLDNDGDTDAIVHLFDIVPVGTTTPLIVPPQFPLSIGTYSFGWRYLKNVIGQPGSGVHWFQDVAPTQMRTPAGTYDPAWNRGLGMDVLADFDNNGALDLFTTVGFAKKAGDVVNVSQTRDLLFLNGVGTAKGILTESSATKLPAACTDQVLGDTPYISCGSFGIAQGDVDNDGDADVAIAHYGQLARTNYPWLLINGLPSGGTMVDQFKTKVNVNALSPVIHTAPTDPAGNPTPGMDHAMFPAFADLDADGDLDLIYQVVDDLPRVLLNKGTDSNGDGVITSADSPPPGDFTDITPTILTQYRRTPDSQDLQAIDVDLDGDLDLANDPFNDRVTFWRNDLKADSGRPVVTEAWPRVGSIRRAKIRLEGIELTGVVKVQFRFAGGAICEQTATTPIGTDGRHLDVVIPQTCPIGLAQVRVLRAKPSCGNPSVTVQRWSRQYFGYFIQG